jgi:hypothetical protein
MALPSVLGGWDRAIILWHTPPVVRHTARDRITLDISLPIPPAVVLAMMSSQDDDQEAACYRRTLRT